MSFKSILYFIFFLIPHKICGQQTIKIILLDEKNEPIANATVKRLNQNYFQVSDNAGLIHWVLTNSTDSVVINHIGYKSKSILISRDSNILLESLIEELQGPQIISNWVEKNSFVAHTTLFSKQLEKKQLIQDIPFLLQNLPSTVSTSDGGNGVGYTGIRIRGLDPTQINVLINGVPLNDAESQIVYWVDMPDIIASASEIQVQRGIGLSGSGQVAFGSSILINTNKFNSSPYINIETGIGTFYTKKTNIEAGTGTLNGNWNINGRLSRISSHGFIERAKSNLWSGNISISKIESKRSLKLHVFDGLEKTYQAWYGTPVQYIQNGNRKYNAAGTEKSGTPYENQIDHYRQTHFQFLHSEVLNSIASMHNTFHFTPGAGYYEEYKSSQKPEDYALAASDPISIVRRRFLENNYFGSIHSIDIEKRKNKYQAGVSWNIYSGKHFGNLIEIDGIKLHDPISYYKTNANKKSAMAFGKSEFKLKKIAFTIDLQYRMLSYDFTPELSKENQTIVHHFFNPKIGFSIPAKNNIQLFGFSGLAHREPNRDDYIRAGNVFPSAEKLWDNELGIRRENRFFSWEQNFYYMKYKNQLIPTGKINDIGAYIRSNVPDSYRMGSETSLNLKPNTRCNVDFNLTLAKNKTNELIEYIDNWDLGNQETIVHKNKDISFSPARIWNISGEYAVVHRNQHHINLDFSFQSIGSQFLDGTQNAASKLNSYSISNAGLLYTLRKNGSSFLNIKISCLNLLDTKYESNGWIYRFNSPSYDPVPNDPYAQAERGSIYSLKGLFPQAGRNFLVSIKWRILHPG